MKQIDTKWKVLFALVVVTLVIVTVAPLVALGLDAFSKAAAQRTGSLH